MKKLSKQSITRQYAFEADDGTKYPYAGQAIERDIEILEESMEEFKRGNVNISDLNLTGSIYKIEDEESLTLVKKYCDLRNFLLKDLDIPTNVIITDNFVLSTEELKNLAEEIGNL